MLRAGGARVAANVRAYPLTAVWVVLLAAYLAAMGVLLAAWPDLRTLAGPRAVLPPRAWSVLFLLAAAVKTARLAVLDNHRLDFLLHLAGVAVLAGWLVAWALGSAPLAVPAFALVLAASLLSPYLGEITSAAGRRELRRLAAAPTPTPTPTPTITWRAGGVAGEPRHAGTHTEEPT